MRMTTTKMICFRLFNITLGRFSIISKLTKKCLIRVLVGSNKQERYTASSKFFTISELESGVKRAE